MTHRLILVSLFCLVSLMGCKTGSSNSSGVMDAMTADPFFTDDPAYRPMALLSVYAQHPGDPQLASGVKSWETNFRNDSQAYKYRVMFFDGTSAEGIAQIVIPCNLVSSTDATGAPTQIGVCTFQDPANSVSFDMPGNGITYQGSYYPFVSLVQKTICIGHGAGCGGE